MAKRYLDWPGGLTVFDVRTEAMAPFVEGGATAAASVAEVAEPTSSASPCSTTRRCARCTASWLQHAKPGTVIAIHSTISDTTAVELAEASSSRRAFTSWTRRSAEARGGRRQG